MRKYRDGERATNQSKAWKLRRDDYSEGAEDVEAGWEAIAGLGVQVPKELMEMWKPKLDDLMKNPRTFQKMFDAYDKATAIEQLKYPPSNSLKTWCERQAGWHPDCNLK